MEQSFNFQAKTSEEITEKVAAVMKGIVKGTESGISNSIEKKKAMKPVAEFIIEISQLGLTINEVEFLCDGIKYAIKKATIFKTYKKPQKEKK